tara:strand:+ start:170 stop:2275 length:2106 start_codon:yes stop_codon:yes gene_type:complete
MISAPYKSRVSVPGTTGVQPYNVNSAVNPFEGAQEAAEKVSGFIQDYQKREENSELLEVRSQLAKGRELNTLFMQNLPMAKGGEGFTNSVTDQMTNWYNENILQFKTKKAQDAFNQGYDSFQGSLSVRANAMENQAFDNYQKQTIIETIDIETASVYKNPEIFDEVLSEGIKRINGMEIDGNLKEILINKAKSRLAKAQVESLILLNPRQTKEDLENGRWDSFINGENKISLLKESEIGISKEKAETAIDIALAHGDLILAELGGDREKIKEASNNYYSLIDNVPKTKAIQKQLIAIARLKSKKENKTATELEEQQLLTAKLELGAKAYSGEIVLSQSDKKHVDIINLFYNEVSQGWENLTPDEKINLSVDFIKRTGIIPKLIETNIVAGLNSADDSKVIASAIMLDKITNAHARSIEQIPNKFVSFGYQVLEYNQNGLSPQDSVKKTNEMRDMSSNKKEARQREYREIEKTTPTTDVLQKYIDGGWMEGGDTPFNWRADPTKDEVITAEFQDLRETEYVRTGDDEVAQKAAFAMIKKNWGVTQIDGDYRFMKKAPELVYGQPNLTLEENTEWMRDQLISDYESFIAPSNELDIEADIENKASNKLILRVNPTQTTKDGNPVYSVFYQDKYGLIKLRENFNWVPDYTGTVKFSLQQEEFRKQNDAAIKRRAFPFIGGSPEDLKRREKEKDLKNFPSIQAEQ